jgi:membrane protease YdiL (CAAX protease family)
MLPTLKVIQAGSSIIIFGIPALAWSWYTYREHPLYHLGVRAAERAEMYLFGALLLLLSFPLQGILGQFNKSLPLPHWMISWEESADKQLKAFLTVRSTADILVNLLIVGLLPAIFEELCFRGALQRILIQMFKRPIIAILLTGAFFSAFHMQFLGFFPRMFMGVLLGLIYWYSGSLWTSIIAHFVVNGSQVLLVSYYPKMITEDPGVPGYTAFISLAFVVGLWLVISRRSTKSVLSWH